MSSDGVRVLFYGLFMDESLLASKGIRPLMMTVGHVDGYRLRLGRRATLVRDQTSRAYGVLMTLTAGDVNRLYSDEGVVDYLPEPVSVVLPDGSVESALCYNLPEVGLEGANREYGAALLALAAKLGLPESYLQQIRAQAA